MYQTSTTPLLRLIDQQTIGDMPAYALFDLPRQDWSRTA